MAMKTIEIGLKSRILEKHWFWSKSVRQDQRVLFSLKTGNLLVFRRREVPDSQQQLTSSVFLMFCVYHCLPEDDPLEQLEKLQREKLCKICWDRDIGIVFIPCGHLVACKECSETLFRCPICCGGITHKVKTYVTWGNQISPCMNAAFSMMLYFNIACRYSVIYKWLVCV